MQSLHAVVGSPVFCSHTMSIPQHVCNGTPLPWRQVHVGTNDGIYIKIIGHSENITASTVHSPQRHKIVRLHWNMQF